MKLSCLYGSPTRRMYRDVSELWCANESVCCTWLNRRCYVLIHLTQVSTNLPHISHYHEVAQYSAAFQSTQGSSHRRYWMFPRVCRIASTGITERPEYLGYPPTEIPGVLPGIFSRLTGNCEYSGCRRRVDSQKYSGSHGTGTSEARTIVFSCVLISRFSFDIASVWIFPCPISILFILPTLFGVVKL